MTERSIGKIFAEIDLDPKGWDRSLAQIRARAENVTLNVESNFKNLGIKSESYFVLSRTAAENAYMGILQSSRSTAADILRAEEAKHAKITALNEQQFGKQTSFLQTLKENWLATSAAAVAVWATVNKAMQYVELGAKAEQAAESFRLVADSSRIGADALLANLNRAAAGTVDDSDIMQSAVKGMVLGLNDQQLVTIMETARLAARYAGTDVKTAFQDITNAIGTDMPRALKQYGLITREETKQVQEALSAGAKDVSLYALAMAHAAVNSAKFGEAQSNAAERVQIFHAVVNEAKEGVGKAAIGMAEYVAAAGLWLDALGKKSQAAWAAQLGDEGARKDLTDAANESTRKMNVLLGVQTEESKKATEAAKEKGKVELGVAEATLKREQQKVAAAAEAAKEAKRAEGEREQAIKQITEATRKAAVDSENLGRGAFELERARIDSTAGKYRELGVGRVLILKYVAAESALVNAKESEERRKWELGELDRRRDAYEKFTHLDEQTGKGFEDPAGGDVENARARRRVLDAEQRESFQTLATQIRAASYDYDDYESNRLVTYQATQGEIDAARLAGSIRDRQRLSDEFTQTKRLYDDDVTAYINAELLKTGRYQDENRKRRDKEIGLYEAQSALRQRDVRDEQTALMMKYDATTDYFEKVKLGMEISTKDYKSSSDKMLDTIKGFASAATRSLDDLYFSVLTGKFTSFGDWLKNFWSNIARVISNELATSTASWFSSLLKSGGGGGSGSVAGAAGTVVSVVSDIWSWLGSLDEGMWKVPGGTGTGSTSTYGGNWKSTRRGTGSGGGSAWIHPDEMVVPADIAELLRQAVGRAGGRGFGDLEDLLQGGGGRGVSAPSSGAYGPMSQAEKESLSEIGGFQNRDLSVSSAFGALASVVGAGKLGKTALDAMISSILAFEAVRANLGVSSSFGYKQMDPVDIQAVQDLYGPEAARRAAVEDAIMASIDADKRNALGLGAAAVASARANVSKEANEYEGGFRDPGIDTDTASFGGYGRGDPGYGDSPGMGDPGGGDGGGRTGDSNDPGGPSADDGSGMSLAAGALFRTRGRTRLTVGEAGSETVAVLRNPREVMAGGGGGGNRLTVNLSIGHVYGPGGIGEAARVLMAEIGRLESRRIKY